MQNNNLQKNINKTIFGSIMSGILGALSGAEKSSKLFRRIGLPFFLAGVAWEHLHHWYIFSIFLMYPILSLGYGIPSDNDAGSSLGRFFYALFKGNSLFADICTRGLIGCLIGATLAPIALITGHYWLYLGGLWTIISVYAFISWQSIGVFEFQGKRLIWSEFWTYFTVGCISLILIYF